MSSFKIEKSDQTYKSLTVQTLTTQKQLTSMRIKSGLLSTERLVDNTAANIWEKRDAVVSLYMKFTGLPPPDTELQFSGSGFFVSPDGYLVTCSHNVIDLPTPPTPPDPPPTINPDIPRILASEIYASVTNVNGEIGRNEEIKMTIVGVDGAGDIAVLRPESVVLTNQTYLKWGKSRASSNGDTVFVLGDPSGLDQQSISKGIIRDKTYLYATSVEAVLFDAPVLGGNSGGPFVDVNGNVLGITTFGLDNSESLVGGVSQYIAERVSNEIISTQADYVKGYLGWQIFPITLVDKDFLRDLYPPGDIASMDGQYIFGLRDVSVLDIPEDSIITQVDGININVVNDPIKEHTTNITWFKKPGDVIEVVYRDPNESFVSKTALVTLLPFPVGYEIPLDNYVNNPTNNPTVSTKLLGPLKRQKRSMS
jgi:S1-C subfamily serine protease